MAVPAGERSKPKLEAIIRAMELAAYTIKICGNKNIFLPEYADFLTRDIVHCAKEIYTNAWKGNNINVSANSEMKHLRCEYQTKAVASCYELLALIQLAKPVYHLTSKRIRHWGKLTIDTRQLLKAWKDADAKRYGY